MIYTSFYFLLSLHISHRKHQLQIVIFTYHQNPLGGLDALPDQQLKPTMLITVLQWCWSDCPPTFHWTKYPGRGSYNEHTGIISGKLRRTTWCWVRPIEWKNKNQRKHERLRGHETELLKQMSIPLFANGYHNQTTCLTGSIEPRYIHNTPRSYATLCATLLQFGRAGLTEWGR